MDNTKHSVTPVNYKDPFVDFDYPVSSPIEKKENKTEGQQKKRERKKESSTEEYVSPIGIKIDVPPALHKDFKTFCIEKGVSMKDYLLNAIKEAVEAENNK